jgi:hypothetical protein
MPAMSEIILLLLDTSISAGLQMIAVPNKSLQQTAREHVSQVTSLLSSNADRAPQLQR